MPEFCGVKDIRLCRKDTCPTKRDDKPCTDDACLTSAIELMNRYHDALERIDMVLDPNEPYDGDVHSIAKCALYRR